MTKEADEMLTLLREARDGLHAHGGIAVAETIMRLDDAIADAQRPAAAPPGCDPAADTAEADDGDDALEYAAGMLRVIVAGKDTCTTGQLSAFAQTGLDLIKQHRKPVGRDPATIEAAEAAINFQMAAFERDVRISELTSEEIHSIALAASRAISPEMRRLIIAARSVAFDGPNPDATALKELDTASEAFADAIPWDDEPAVVTEDGQTP